MSDRVVISASGEIIENPNNAGSKARIDAERILSRSGFRIKSIPFYRYKNIQRHKAKYIYFRIRDALDWMLFFAGIKRETILAFEWPTGNTRRYYDLALRMKKLKKLQILTIIHDIDSLRFRDFFSKEEIRYLGQADALIVHNKKMKEVCIQMGFDSQRIHILNIFDYCMEEDYEVPERELKKEVSIAGNLMRKKASYIYDLPDSRVVYHLYGENYEDHQQDHVIYHGSFSPEEIPKRLEGSFGLVWDGNETGTCKGAGQYLKYNNPHKVSLYVVSGLPVIIWDGAAMAEFVKEKNIGFTIEKIEDIPEKIESMSEDEFAAMQENVRMLGSWLKKGSTLENILREIISI